MWLCIFFKFLIFIISLLAERSLPTLVVAGVSIALVLLCILIVTIFWYAWKKSQEGSIELNPLPYSEAGVSLRSLSVPESQQEWPFERAVQWQQESCCITLWEGRKALSMVDSWTALSEELYLKSYIPEVINVLLRENATLRLFSNKLNLHRNMTTVEISWNGHCLCLYTCEFPIGNGSWKVLASKIWFGPQLVYQHKQCYCNAWEFPRHCFIC